MRSSRDWRRAALIAVLLLVGGCSSRGSDGGDPSTPTAPSGPPPPSGVAGWQGTVTGTLAGTAPDTQFVGNVALQSPSATGTGVCGGQITMAGPSVATSMRWEAPALTMSPNVPTQPASACQGTVFTLVWIFTRR